MKTICSLILGVTLSTSLIAQTELKSPPRAAAAPETGQAPSAPLSRVTLDKLGRMTPLFDGATLHGWVQDPTNSPNLARDDILDLPALAKQLLDKRDAVSAFVNEQLDDAVKTALAEYSPASTNVRAVKSALAKNLNRMISGPSLYEESRFRNVHLRPETLALRDQDPQGPGLMRLNRLLLEDAYPSELARSPATAWIVKDGAMASTGAGRGTIYTTGDYGKFRLIFNMRHVSGQPDHQACVLIFCTRPSAGEKGLDALGGIQFQVPNGGHWDYRPGHNNAGKGEFTQLPHPKFDVHEWSQVEILADAATGTARMAVAQPPGSRAVEVLDFKDPTAGKEGPVAWQMHNGGLFDEYKDVRIEVNPAEDKLITSGFIQTRTLRIFTAAATGKTIADRQAPGSSR
jgi:3-keto-disaccharide hydrolase